MARGTVQADPTPLEGWSVRGSRATLAYLAPRTAQAARNSLTGPDPLGHGPFSYLTCGSPLRYGTGFPAT